MKLPEVRLSIQPEILTEVLSLVMMRCGPISSKTLFFRDVYMGTVDDNN